MRRYYDVKVLNVGFLKKICYTFDYYSLSIGINSEYGPDVFNLSFCLILYI